MFKNIKGKNNPNYKNGRSLKQYYCTKYNKKIHWTTACYGTGLCNKCIHNLKSYRLKISNANKNRKFTKKMKQKMSQIMIQVCNTKEYKSKISKSTKKMWNNPIIRAKLMKAAKNKPKPNKVVISKRARSIKKKWSDPIHRQKQITAIIKAFNFIQNKCEKKLEKILNNICHKKYKYVGDGKIFIAGYVPDFISRNKDKKIIELFGDYWHNREDAKKRDKLRLKTYKKYGYKTLIIWEHELKDLSKLKLKILRFNQLKKINGEN